MDFDSHKDITIPPFIDTDVILQKRKTLINKKPYNYFLIQLNQNKKTKLKKIKYQKIIQ